MASRSHVSYDNVQRGIQRSVDPRTAFDIGYQQATDGLGDGSNSVRHVKNNYEQRLANYLKQLPNDPDFAGVPKQFRNNLSNYLSNAKSEYVAAANAIDDMEVGSDQYMETMAKMNNIKSSFETLDGQFKLYNSTKKTVIDDIEGQRISMYGENQANANLLRGIFNEEYEIEIDETGNLYFVGDDGKIGLNDLPDYGMKDFDTADKMVTMGVNVFQNGAKNGLALKQDDVMYHQYSNRLKRMIYNGGKNTLMSVLYDGLVGDIAMADDPAMKELINGYENGAVGFDELTKATVDSYMKTLVQQSANGTKQRKVNPIKSGGSDHLASDGKHFVAGDGRPYQRRMPKNTNGFMIRYYDDGSIEHHYMDGSGKIDIITSADGGDNSNANNNEPEEITDDNRSVIVKAREYLENKGIKPPYTNDQISDAVKQVTKT